MTPGSLVCLRMYGKNVLPLLSEYINMEAARSFRPSVNIYHTKRCKLPENCNLHSHLLETSKPHTKGL
jgi:hypothetical protein